MTTSGRGVDPSLLVHGAVGYLTAAWCIHRLGERRITALGLALLGAGMLPLVGGNLPAVVVGMALAGVGIPWTLVDCRLLVAATALTVVLAALLTRPLRRHVPTADPRPEAAAAA